MKDINIFVGTAICMIVILASIFLSIPTTKAYFSYSTGKCTKLIRIEEGKEKTCDCSTLKETEKYERIWVK